MKTQIALVATGGEITLLLIAVTLWLHRRKYPLATACALAIVITMMGLSLSVQTAFLIGVPALSLLFEGVALLTALLYLGLKKESLGEIGRGFGRFFYHHPLISLLLFSAWCYIGLQAFLIPPDNWDGMTYNLARVLLFERAGTPFVESVTTVRQAIFPVGSDMLMHVWLRLGTDYGIGTFSLLSYIAIAFGVYALSRRFAPRRIAALTALIASSLPEIILQASSIKNDIIAAAVGIACFIVVIRLLDKLNRLDFCLLLLFGSFGISVKLNFAFFALPFALVFGYLLLRAHPWREWLALIGQLLRRDSWVIVPTIIFSQIWLFIHNMKMWGGPYGSEVLERIHQHDDGFLGMAANLSRYLFQMLHFTVPVDIWWQEWTGWYLSAEIKALHEQLFGALGTAGISYFNPVTFNIIWLPHEDFSWFGPLAALLIVPALLWAIVRAPARLRGLALVIVSYLLIFCYTITWMPWNHRFFTLFFAPASVAVAYLLRNSSRIVTTPIQLIATATLLYAALFNQPKAMFMRYWPHSEATYGSLEFNIWEETDWGKDRVFYADNFYGDNRLTEWESQVPPDARVGLRTQDETWVYPFLLHWESADFIPINYGSPPPIADLDYLLCLDVVCEEEGIVMVAGSAESAWISGALYKVVPPQTSATAP